MTFFRFIIDTIARLSAPLAFVGATTVDLTHNEDIRLWALGLYLIAFMVDHARG